MAVLRPAGPRNVLMTVDAVGGVWRHALDLAGGLAVRGVRTTLLGFGPEPTPAHREEAARAGIDLRWEGLPLDWMATSADEIADVPAAISRHATEIGADLLHLNLPSQAKRGALPTVAVHHSCLATWWQTVCPRDYPPQGWKWHAQTVARGVEAADILVAPSSAHSASISMAYGPILNLRVVHNGRAGAEQRAEKQAFVLAVGRWWDRAKDLETLDAAAQGCRWPVELVGPLTSPAGETVRVAHCRARGGLPAAEVDDLMSEAALFVSTAVFEPFGLAVLEAAQSGAALVVSDIPTFRELWDEAAIFVPPRDEDGFRSAINHLASDDDHRAAMAAAAQARAAAYSLDRQVDGMLAVYAEAREIHLTRNGAGC